MRVRDWITAGIVGIVISGCAGMQSELSPETRAAMAPTGKLRVAFLLVPIYAGKDPASGDLKGVAVDLGKELARRVGVPFEPIVFPRVAEIMEGLRSGQADVTFTNATPARAKDLDFTAPLLAVEQHALAKKQMDGFGAMLTFGVQNGVEGGRTLVNQVRLITLAVSLGGVESLIEHPASMTHAGLPREEREQAGIGDEMVRLSVGCEAFEDLRDDLDQALGSIG